MIEALISIGVGALVVLILYLVWQKVVVDALKIRVDTMSNEIAQLQRTKAEVKWVCDEIGKKSGAEIIPVDTLQFKFKTKGQK